MTSKKLNGCVSRGTFNIFEYRRLWRKFLIGCNLAEKEDMAAGMVVK